MSNVPPVPPPPRRPTQTGFPPPAQAPAYESHGYEPMGAIIDGEVVTDTETLPPSSVVNQDVPPTAPADSPMRPTNPGTTKPSEPPAPTTTAPTQDGPAPEPVSESLERNVFADPHVRNAAQALLDFIGDDECSEVIMNGPNECSRKVRGGRYHCPEVTFGDADTYHQVLNEVVLKYCDTQDRIDGTKVVVEGQLELPGTQGSPPMLARVHIIAPPGVKYAKMTIAKKPRVEITLDDMVAAGTMSQDAAEFLKAVSRGHKTFLVSGATGAGKSTLLQALTHHFDVNDRVVVVEETPELRLPLGDVVYLKSSLELPGMDPKDVYSLEFWVKQANRMRMDRIIVGETRGPEMAEWLVAANSGAEGSATTVHAESPRRCLDKVLTLATKSTSSTSESQLRREIAATVDVIVQVGFLDGRHVVTAIEEVSNTVSEKTGQIQTNTLFAFDRTRGAHVVRGRPSDEFTASLALQGVTVNPNWFRNPIPN